MMEEISQAQVDDALVACLRIFARRGRELREQRERALQSNGGTAGSPPLVVLADAPQTVPDGQVDAIFQTTNA